MTVNINIHNDVPRFFDILKCIVGTNYVYNVCEIYKFILIQHNINANINSFYDQNNKQVVIQVDFQELLTERTAKYFIEIVDSLAYEMIPGIHQKLDLKCMKDRKIHIPIHYSVLGKYII